MVTSSRPRSARQPHPRIAEPDLRGRLILLCHTGIRQHSLGQPVGEQVGDVFGRTERGHRRQQRQCGHHRPAVQRGVVQRCARRGAAVDVDDLDQPVLGHEHVGDDDVVGAGRPHPRGVPDVVDLDVVGGQQRQRRIHPVVGAAERADHHPVGVHDAGRPRPAAGQPDTAVGRHAATGRRQRGGAQHRAVDEHLVLGLLVEQRQHPVVQHVEAQRPGGRRATVGHPPDGVQDRREVGLLTAVTGRQQQVGQPAGAEVGDSGGRQPAQFLGLGRPVGQRGKELVGQHARDATIPFSMATTHAAA